MRRRETTGRRVATRAWLLLAATGTVIGAVAQTASAQDAEAPYAGQQARDIASLSADDIADLRAGRGWGLALPAELNGYPGPAHVLEMGEALGLSAAQRSAVQAIFDTMQADAIDAGAAYIDAEAHLSRLFASGHASPARLDAMLEESAGALARLRDVHLAAHLETTPLLSAAQKDTYARLRGYTDDSGGAEGHGGHSGHSGH